ncbi:MAG TPA: hypothetical protein PL074_11180 [Thermoflexales bacterium]|nr:hypothetical protein [Thermoflexales bacterium]
MRIGLDFGTTNTVAAVIGQDGAPIVLPLDVASPTPRMPGASTWALIALILLAFMIQLLHAGSVAGPDIDALSKAGNVGYLVSGQ